MKCKCKCAQSWFKGAVLLGLTFLLAVYLVKPIGVSTQFVIFDGIIWDTFQSDISQVSETAKHGYESTNAYLNKSGGKYAKAVSNPINYSFIFAIAMMIGAFISAKLRGGQSVEENRVPEIHRSKFGETSTKRYIIAFVSGVLVLYGARLAGGCTSGHMMSGMMQTSLSGYLFSLGVFLAAIPTAIFFYKGGK